MRFVFLSPHFDDVALSCGGIVWQLARQGTPAEIWTICAGMPPDFPLSPFAQQLHARWQTSGRETVDRRREEDEEACRRLGAIPRYFDVPDCIYRRLPESYEPLIRGEEDLYQPVHPAELPLVDRLARLLVQTLPPDVHLISPMAMGGHVDHRLVRAVAESLAIHAHIASLQYYTDYPYAIRKYANSDEVRSARFEPERYPVPPTAVEAWQAAIAAYASQISTFWAGVDEMKTAIEQYWLDGGGSQLFSLSISSGESGGPGRYPRSRNRPG